MHDTKLWFPKILQNKLLLEANRASPYEAGGILLGYVADNGDYVVTHLVGPGSEASHGRYRFDPDHDYQKSEINRIFSESNGGSDYLGDWHTHPNGACCMSWVDHRTLQRIGNTPEVNVKHPIMLIACDGRENWRVSGWKYCRSRWFIGAETEGLIINIY